jgi:hypothetical protein
VLFEMVGQLCRGVGAVDGERSQEISDLAEVGERLTTSPSAW